MSGAYANNCDLAHCNLTIPWQTEHQMTAVCSAKLRHSRFRAAAFAALAGCCAFAASGAAQAALGGRYASIAAEMPKGSVLIWDGSLWHGGGANTTSARRTGIAMNYCAGFVRQQENQQLGVPAETARTFEPRLRQLMGYGVYRGLIGHIDKMSPDQLLTGDGGFRSIWDRG